MSLTTTAEVICASCTEYVSQVDDLCPQCGGPIGLRGEYLLLDVLGQGAQGTTYLAERLDDGQRVAIKEMLVRRANSLKALELFEREARVLESLDHPGLPHFYEDFLEEAGRSSAFFLVQEWIDGSPLDELYDGRPIRVEELLEIMAELCDTLAYLQSYSPPVVHRDIKPENIMRRRSDGSLVLIDFGSVRAAIADGDGGGSTVAGTFGYMAPEQFMGQASPASDIYGVAATGVALLADRDPQELMNQHRQIELDSLNLPDNYAEFLQRMLAIDPEDRPSATDAGATLRRLITEGPRNGEIQNTDLPSSSTGLDLPSPPRSLPDGFFKEFAPQSHFFVLFGAIFLSVGTGVPMVLTVVFAQQGLISALFTTLPLMGIFGTIGLVSFLGGLRSRRRAAQVWRLGRITTGKVYRTSQANYSVNRRSPRVYHYRYEVDGRPIEATFHSWNYLLAERGTPVNVIYDPQAPSKSLMVTERADL